MKIMIACRAIHNMAGGIERQASWLMNNLVQQGHEVHFLTLDQAGAQSFYTLDKKIRWFQVDEGDPYKPASISQKLNRMVKIRAYYSKHKPDIIIAYQQGLFITLLCYLAGFSVPIVCSERETPRKFEHQRAGRHERLLWNLLRPADRITTQFESYIPAYPLYLQHKIRAIPNFVVEASNYAYPKSEQQKRKVILSIGRMTFQKNFFVLIKTFYRLHRDFPDWDLHIYGSGEGERDVKRLIAELNLNNRVFIKPAAKEIFDIYPKADLFCLASLWEGFPNTLSEALAHGLPSAGFLSCDGVNNLIKHGYNGIMADKYQSEDEAVANLAEAMRKLMENDDLRKEMSKNAIASMKAYNPEKIYDQWEALIEDVIAKRTGK